MYHTVGSNYLQFFKRKINSLLFCDKTGKSLFLTFLDTLSAKPHYC